MSKKNSSAQWGAIFLGTAIVGILGYALAGDFKKVTGFGLLLGIFAVGYAVRWVFSKVTKKSNTQNTESVAMQVEPWAPTLEAATPQDQSSAGQINNSGPSYLYCEQCGTASRPGAKFCRNCSHKLQA